MPTTVSLTDFGVRPGDGQDATLAIRRALAHCRATGAERLVLPTGRYDCWPDRATERFLFVSNNDEGLKSIVFALDGFDGFEIDGQGSQLVCHRHLVPFALLGSANIRLANFSMDWDRTFHSEALVLAAGEGWAELEFSDAYPFKVEHEQLAFVGERGDRLPLGNLLEFDPLRHETAFRVWDNYGAHLRQTATVLGERRVRFEARFATVPTPGHVLAMMCDSRLCPGIVISGSRQVELDDVTLNHCGGMGVIAQRSEDLTLRRVRVEPSRGRIVSITADATHFVNCRGQILMEDCLFANQMDDPTNVHGIYARVSQRVADRELEVELIHGQQLGIDVTGVGDAVELVRGTTLQPYHANQVVAVERLDKRFSRLTLADALPADVEAGDALDNRTWQADVTIRGCTARGNRARGFLISTGGRALVEHNHFHVPGAAVLVAGDANYWYESGAVTDLTVRGNHFDNCLYGCWGGAVIEIHPEVKPEQRAATRYHRNIVIEDNTFTAFDPRLLKAHCVDGLTWRRNRVVPSTDYPVQTAGAAFAVEACSGVTLEV